MSATLLVGVRVGMWVGKRGRMSVDVKVVLWAAMLGSAPRSTSWRRRRTKCLANRTHINEMN